MCIRDSPSAVHLQCAHVGVSLPVWSVLALVSLAFFVLQVHTDRACEQQQRSAAQKRVEAWKNDPHPWAELAAHAALASVYDQELKRLAKVYEECVEQSPFAWVACNLSVKPETKRLDNVSNNTTIVSTWGSRPTPTWQCLRASHYWQGACARHHTQIAPDTGVDASTCISACIMIFFTV